MLAMAHPRKSPNHVSTNGAVSSVGNDKDTRDDPIDPRTFGLAKVAYAVGETLDLLSIGRTALYAAVKRGDLKRVKFGKKTLFYAAGRGRKRTDGDHPGCRHRRRTRTWHRRSHQDLRSRINAEEGVTWQTTAQDCAARRIRWA
jgi:hypothetical protein